ncbi:MAG: hypothetical protein NT137_06560 [Methanomassiliicoccales archaeon]|nr:hypothetical protein [Methanomassiliicoccales archaeon]
MRRARTGLICVFLGVCRPRPRCERSYSFLQRCIDTRKAIIAMAAMVINA